MTVAAVRGVETARGGAGLRADQHLAADRRGARAGHPGLRRDQPHRGRRGRREPAADRPHRGLPAGLHGRRDVRHRRRPGRHVPDLQPGQPRARRGGAARRSRARPRGRLAAAARRGGHPTAAAPSRLHGLRLAKHQTAHPWRARKLEAGQPREQLGERHVRLEPGEVHPDAYVRAARERQVAAGVRPRRVEAVRVRERRRVAVGGGDRDPDEVAGGDRRAAQLDVGGRVAVDDRGGGLQPQRLLERVLEARARPGASSRCTIALAIIPSVVSMPPNSITAALEVTSAAQEPAAAAASSESPPSVGRTASPSSRTAASASGPRRAPRAEVGDGGHDRVVPAEHRGGLGVAEAERARHHRGRERAGELAPQLGLPARLERGRAAAPPRRAQRRRAARGPRRAGTAR